MKAWFWAGFGVVALAAMGTGSYVLFTPKIGHATKAEIDAVLPPSLKVKDTPDEAGEGRYARLIEALGGLDKESLRLNSPSYNKFTTANEQVAVAVEKVLAEGSIRLPERKGNMLFKDSLVLKNAAKMIAMGIEDAWTSHDRAAALRWSLLGLRYAEAVHQAGGVLIDQLIAVAVEAIEVRAIYRAEIEGGFDSAGQRKLLALLKPQDGKGPDMADAVRRDFNYGWMPTLLDPQAHVKELAAEMDETLGDSAPEEPLAGTFDPVASAKLAGDIYAETMADLRRPYRQEKKIGDRLADEAQKGLPVPSGDGKMKRYWYRFQMNSGRNTLGRRQAAAGVFGQLGLAVAREAASWNLLRAVIQLRIGETPKIVDPLGTGTLRVDQKKKLVWSVGADGRDDGGRIGRGWEPSGTDFGCPYGDHSWEPRKVTTGSYGPAGAVPPGFGGPGTAPPGAPGLPAGSPGAPSR